MGDSRTPNLYFTLWILAVVALACGGDRSTSTVDLAYPETATIDQVDTYHGIEVADGHSC